MDPLRALDMEVRSGISSSEIDDFASRMDMVRSLVGLYLIQSDCCCLRLVAADTCGRCEQIAQAMDEIKNGTFDPAACKVRCRLTDCAGRRQ